MQHSGIMMFFFFCLENWVIFDENSTVTYTSIIELIRWFLSAVRKTCYYVRFIWKLPFFRYHQIQRLTCSPFFHGAKWQQILVIINCYIKERRCVEVMRL